MAKLNDGNLKAMANNASELNQHIFSPMYIYNLLYTYDPPTDYHGGTSIWKAYRLLQQFGAVKEVRLYFFAKNNFVIIKRYDIILSCGRESQHKFK